MIALLALAFFQAIPTMPYQPDDFTSLLLHFDEGRGTQAHDASEFNNTCFIENARWARGRFGTSLDFRKGGIALVPFHPSLQPLKAFTLEAWIWAEGPAQEIQRLVFRPGVFGFYLVPRTGHLLFFVNAGGKWEAVTASMAFRRWVHIAGVYDGREMRLYIDGSLKARKGKRGLLIRSGVPLIIGANDRRGMWQFHGLIDEVRLSHIARKNFNPLERLTFRPTTSLQVLSAEKITVPFSRPRLRLGRCVKPPTIDGQLTDEIWKEALRCRLIHAPPDQKITQPTWVLLAYDATYLYIAFRCHEDRMDRIVARYRKRDSDVWRDDCVEVFLMPSPKGRLYYHIVVNPLGALYDARHLGVGKADREWDAEARVGVKRGKKSWTVELAIPFRALGIPEPKVKETWLANFCRQERPHGEWSAWSPVGRRFHQPQKFGVIEFGVTPGKGEEEVKVVGLLRDITGRRVQGVKIFTSRGPVQTDALGYFTISVRKGRNRFLVRDPRYEPLAWEVTVRRDEERILPPPLKPINPYTYTFPLPPSKRGYWVVPIHYLNEPPLKRPPSNLLENPTLQAFVTPGEYEPLSFVIYAQKALRDVRITATPLRAQAVTVPAPEIRTVVRYFRRWWFFSPPDEGSFVSRFLLKFQPLTIPPKNFRQFWLTVHVPEETPPGVYRGTIHIMPQNARATRVTLFVRVLPFSLKSPPHKRHGVYYRGIHPQILPEKLEAVIRKELEDIRKHGCRVILWTPRILYERRDGRVEILYDDVRRKLRLLKEFGFEPPYIVWTGFPLLARLLGHPIDTDRGSGWERLGRDGRFYAIAKQALQGLLELAEREGFPEIVVTHMDEVFSGKRLSLFIALTKAVRQVPGVRVYITLNNCPRPGIPEKIRRLDPFVDIRCYHGHCMDEWLAAGHSFEELRQELEVRGDEAWTYYNPRSLDVTPKWIRLVNGLWLWLSPIQVHCPWIYNAYLGDPLNDADGHDYGFAFPVGDEIVPTRLWEAFREGVDDLRYLWTLEVAIKEHGPQKPRVADRAREWLLGLRRRLLSVPMGKGQSAFVRALARHLSGEELDQIRRECADFILSLEGKGKREKPSRPRENFGGPDGI